jgi:hypothetical protein
MSALPALLQGARARAWAWWLVPMLVLGLLVGWEIDWGRQLVRVPPAAVPLEPKPVAPMLLPDYAIEGGLPANSETVNRTLFIATRRPAPVVAGEGGPRSFKAGQFQLVGTTMNGNQNVAFLKEVAGGKSHAVRQGEKINGMLVASVTSERVKLTLGDEAEELVLKVAPGPKTTLGAPPPPPVAAATAAVTAVPASAAAAGTAAVAQPVRAAAVPGLQQVENARAARRAARQAQSQGGQSTQGGFGPLPPQGTGK